METSKNLLPQEQKIMRNTELISDYKIFSRAGKPKADIVVILMNKYNIKKSLVYNLINSIQNA
jgi:hypothetical protein